MSNVRLLVTVFGTVVLLTPAGAAFAQSWNGGYVAAHVGFGVQREDSDESILFDKNLDGTFTDTIVTAAGANAFSPGFCGGAATSPVASAGCVEDEDGLDLGVRAGYDWQRGRFVFGVRGEFSRPDVTDSVTAFSTTPASYTFTREVESLLGFGWRACIGADRVLLYGVGTAAWCRIDNRFSTSNTVNTFVESDDDGSWGYQAGAGVEMRLGQRVTAGGEYLYTELRDENRYTVRAQGPAPATNPFIVTSAAGTDFRRSESFSLHSLRGTLAFRF
jgi:outer membrane immunogenic protein